MPKPHILAIKGIIASILFAGLIIWVQSEVGWHEVLAIWSNITPSLLLVICGCIFISHALRVLRVVLAYRKKFNVRTLDVAGVSLVHNTISFLLPMRLGEAALPLLSKNKLNVELRYSLSALVLLRLFDAHVLLMLILIFGSATYLAGIAKIISWSIVLSTPIALVIAIFFLRRSSRFEVIEPLVNSFRSLLSLYFTTALLWIVKLSSLAALVCQLGISNLNHAWIATIIADASALSPITGFANAGTFEAAFMFPLLPLGYDSAMLLGISLNLHILILLTNLAAGAFGVIILLFKNSTRQV